jgi:hypothetical protein
MACFRRNPAVKRLAELADNHEIVHCTLPQRTEHISPNIRKWLMPPTEYIAEAFPRIGRHIFAEGEIAYRHVAIKITVGLRDQCDYRQSCHKNHLFATRII